ncbi:hypothetical protein [Pseudochryseolinea flava]|uniref:Uncharacterized protein n=1 Tax=Pseudochryseolinea flava TaxID=2059302 RepID=A0A364Y5D1_9BACT|nr:hypothetical protein [Pseudochryseolinea flava]RAW02206.1 hypothetical protein DQQ10_06600 [Pseudochryseolinea flava]
MDKQIRDILLKFDEADRYERPSNFNYDQLKSRVINLVDRLENVFRLKFAIDDQVQDASFFCDVKIPFQLVTRPRSNVEYSIRISNFGGLVTLTFDEEYSEDVKGTIKSVLAEMNFVFIYSDDLDEDYDGSFDKFNEILGGTKPSWWIRYFDYL